MHSKKKAEQEAKALEAIGEAIETGLKSLKTTPKKRPKKNKNKIGKKAFLIALQANQTASYDDWIDAMKEACIASGGWVNEDDFKTSVRRKAGQVLRYINELESTKKDWIMPDAPAVVQPTYADIAKDLGLL